MNHFLAPFLALCPSMRNKCCSCNIFWLRNHSTDRCRSHSCLPFLTLRGLKNILMILIVIGLPSKNILNSRLNVGNCYLCSRVQGLWAHEVVWEWHLQICWHFCWCFPLDMQAQEDLRCMCHWLQSDYFQGAPWGWPKSVVF